MGQDLTAVDVAALETRTEGWITRLKLAALSMQGREDVAGFIKAFSGDDRYIVDYLVEAVKQLIDPSTLRYVVVPHFEGDACGFEPVLRIGAKRPACVQSCGCSPVGAVTNIADFSIREPVAMEDGQILDLGQHRLECMVTPYVHTWDGMLPFEHTTGTQFCSDVFIQPGPGPATTDEAEIEGMLAMYKMIGIFPSRAHPDSALDKIEAQNPKVLACHHGNVITGQIPAYIKAMRESDIIGVTEWNPLREARN